MAVAVDTRTRTLAGLALLTALNLRTAIASVPPLLDDITGDLALSATAAGVLTTLPVICMALGSPVAPWLARLRGMEAGLSLVGLTIAAGILVRLAPGAPFLYLGTIIAGLGIAVGNVLVPALIKRDFADRVGPMTGAYTMAISASGALGAALTVPFEEALGGGWRAALAVWALPALVAGALWWPRARAGAAAARAVPAVRPPRTLWRRTLAWQVTGFMGLQSLSFYSILSWLPELLRDQGTGRAAAGALLSVVMLAGIPACLAAPALAERGPDQRAAVTVTIALLAAGLLGLLLAPGTATLLWVVLIGIAQGALLALAFLFFALRTHDSIAAGELAAMAQTGGYLLAATGPLTVGLLHDATGGWDVPLAYLLVVCVPMLACGLGAARSSFVS